MKKDHGPRQSGISSAQISHDDLENFLGGDRAATHKLLAHAEGMVISQLGDRHVHARADILSVVLERVFRDGRRLTYEFAQAQQISRNSDAKLLMALRKPLAEIIGCKASTFVFKRVIWSIKDYIAHRGHTLLGSEHAVSELESPPSDPVALCDLRRILLELLPEELELLYCRYEGLTFVEMVELLDAEVDVLRQRYHRLIVSLRRRYPEMCFLTNEAEDDEAEHD